VRELKLCKRLEKARYRTNIKTIDLGKRRAMTVSALLAKRRMGSRRGKENGRRWGGETGYFQLLWGDVLILGGAERN